ncbi:FtsH protease activity modulator HflK [Fretibacter rubidus]|uniref:FtsH protease activity modulator HflK n=1 Tax=Fretibacter rubidus TaxID=570162 RepID=UPI003529F220
MSDNKSPWGGKDGGKKPSRSSGQNPWGQGQGTPDRNRPRPGETSADLENVIQGFKTRFGQGGNGGGRGGRPGRPQGPLSKFGPFGIFIAVGAGIMLLSTVYQVDQQEEAVVLRFGEYVRTTGPGLNFKLPSPFETTIIRPTRVVQKTTVGGRDSLMLTGDENIVDINFTVLWRINDLKDYVFEVDEPDVALRGVAESAMREVVGRSELEDVITTARLETTIAVRDLMQLTLDEYKAGIDVVEVQLQKADAPEGRVVDAFREVVDATQEKETLINQATAVQNTLVPAARGDAAKILQDAEAYKGRVVAEARGEAERFNLILEEYTAAPRVTRQRMYLETIEEVYAPAEKIILDSSAGSGVVPYLPLDRLGRNAGAN